MTADAAIQARATISAPIAHHGTERTFLLPWLCSAAVVTFIRLLHATDLGYDLTRHIQAAQNLLAGKGLSI